MTNRPDLPDALPADPPQGADFRNPANPIPAPWGDPTLTLDRVDPQPGFAPGPQAQPVPPPVPGAGLPSGVPSGGPPSVAAYRGEPTAMPGTPAGYPFQPPPQPPFQPPFEPIGASSPFAAPAQPPSPSPFGPPLAGSGIGSGIGTGTGTGLFAPAGSPPPPSYPPIHRFPDPAAGSGANGAANANRSRRRAARWAVAVAALALMAIIGFVGGRALTRDDAASSAGSANASTVGGADGSGGENATAGSVAAPTADQQGPVTRAPDLDPDLQADPAAAVHDAVSPAVVQIETSSGLGTGFVYDAQGYILTAAHVVSLGGALGGADPGFESEVTVRLADGTRVRGQVLGSDLNNDVAVVKIEPVPDLPVAALALGEVPRVGSIAIAIGSPFGLDQTVTQGIVSAVNRPVPSPNNNIVSMIQTDAAINSGNSGGPLVDRQGRVLGINTQIRTETGDNNGIGFAVPIDLAYDVAQSLIRGEPIRLGYLGVRTDDPAFGSSGAMVVRVEAASPAATAGIQEGDLVLSVNGQPIRGFEELASIIRATQPGQKLDLVIERDGKELDLSVTVGEATTR
ncbi:MAG: S1C family serine protease [Acidimicrobiales bacterium]